MAPEIDLSKQRPAEFVFSRHVEQKLDRDPHEGEARAKAQPRAEWEGGESESFLSDL